MKTSLNIVSISFEVDPFSKQGGLADVARSLPKALKKLGHKIVVITPLHSTTNPEEFKLKLVKEKISFNIDQETKGTFNLWQGELSPGLFVYFIDHGHYFAASKSVYKSKYGNSRYYFFNVAALEAIKQLKIMPDAIQCHEWHTGLVPCLIKTRYQNDLLLKNAATVFTIHNLAFQMAQDWWEVPDEMKDDGRSPLPLFSQKKKVEAINMAKRAIAHADAINTVSEQYAKEILTPKFGQSLHRILQSREDRLFGIVNGIDYHDYNPATDPGLYINYDVDSLHLKTKNKLALQAMFNLPEDPKVPLIGIASRLTEQKGYDLLVDVLDPLLRLDLQLIVMGGGDAKYEQLFRKVAKKHPKKVSVHLTFEPKHATKVYAGSDMFLMPSRFEPCGLGQLISLRYGSIPIVRSTGGLVDTITDYNARTHAGNGFVFKTYDSRDMLVAIVRAIENHRHHDDWIELMKKGMQLSFSWKIPAKKYVQLFRLAIKNKYDSSS